MALTSFTAGETISPGNVVFLNGSGFLYKASAGAFAQASAVGVLPRYAYSPPSPPGL